MEISWLSSDLEFLIHFQLGFENGKLRQGENDEHEGNFLKGYKNCFNQNKRNKKDQLRD